LVSGGHFDKPKFGYGHLAGSHELLLCGIELERRKTDHGEHPFWVSGVNRFSPMLPVKIQGQQWRRTSDGYAAQKILALDHEWLLRSQAGLSQPARWGSRGVHAR
jgi:hypothetical protein